MAELIIENLRKSYKKKVVVKDISLNVKSGEVVGLLGPNGAGKTTSFYMIVGLVAAENGIIKIDQNELTKMPIHNRSKIGISYLPQEPSIFRKLTVTENILAVLELRKFLDVINIPSFNKIFGFQPYFLPMIRLVLFLEFHWV